VSCGERRWERARTGAGAFLGPRGLCKMGGSPE
jgi:hypothetical protein